MDGPIYSAQAMPPFEKGTAGWAKQSPETNIAACLMPISAKIKAPWGLLAGVAGRHYHQVSTLSNEEGVIDEYPNDRFGDEYEVIRELRYGEDTRGDRLFDLYGPDIKVVLAYKSTPIIVHGRTAGSCRFRTSESKGDKVHVCPPGSVIVSNTAGTRTWAIGPGDFRRLYGDMIRPGSPA